MLVKMLLNVGTVHGNYRAGEVYEISDHVEEYIEKGWAEPAGKPEDSVKRRTKNLPKSPSAQRE